MRYIFVVIVIILFIVGCGEGKTKLTKEQECCKQCVDAAGSLKVQNRIDNKFCASFIVREAFTEDCVNYFESKLMLEQSIPVGTCKEMIEKLDLPEE